jgi:hypothetical protein
MIDFLCKAISKEEIVKELGCVHGGSLDLSIDYLSKCKRGEISDDETYSKIPYAYRYILDVLDNPRLSKYVQNLDYKGLFEQNIEKAKRDRNKQYF